MKRICLCIFLWLPVIKLFATVHTIVVERESFNPSSLNLYVGDTIQWILKDDGGSHTVTSTNIPASAITWDEQVNASSGSFSYFVRVPGTYNYNCEIHSGMKGSFTASDRGMPSADYSDSISLSVTPSPVITSLCINYDLPDKNRLATIQVLNVNGDILFQRERISGMYSDCIESKDLASGIYLVKINGDDFVVSRRFVVE